MSLDNNVLCLKQSGIYDDVFYMMQRRAWAGYGNFDETGISDFIGKGLRRRTLLGKAAFFPFSRNFWCRPNAGCIAPSPS
jgi:hypothetical protein